MKVEDIMEAFGDAMFGIKDPTKRHATTTYDLSRQMKPVLYAIFDKKGKMLAKDKTKEEAENMVKSVTLTKKFGPLTAKRM